MGIKKFCIFLMFVVGGFCGASATVVDSNLYGASKTITENIVISDDATVAVKNLYVNAPITIENHGRVLSDVYVCDMGALNVINSGDMHGTIYLGDGARLNQIVRDADDLTFLNVDGGYNVLVQSEGRILSMRHVMDVASAADKVVLDEAILYLDTHMLMARSMTNIVLNGEVKIISDDFSNYYDSAILNNVSGDGRVVLVDNSDNLLYSNVGYIEDGSLYVRRKRVTDYSKILGDDVGALLNAMRAGGDPLLNKIDSANSVSEIHEIINRSARFNPMEMMRPVIDVVRFDMLNLGMDDAALSVRPVGVAGDDYSVMGIEAEITSIFMDKLYLSFGGEIGAVDYKSDTDEYSAVFYGLNIGAGYRDDNGMFVRARAGVNMTEFDYVYLVGDGKIIDNPQGDIFYGVIDGGYELDLGRDISFLPSVGFRMMNVGIEYETDNFMNFYIGADLDFHPVRVLGIGYRYGLHVDVDTDNRTTVAIRMGAGSDADMISGAISIATIIDNELTSYKAGFDLRLLF